jgi:hypothetical protein
MSDASKFVTTQVDRLKAFSLQPSACNLLKKISLLEPEVVETEKVLNGLIRALRDNV